VKNTSNGNPVMEAIIDEQDVLRITVWQFEANQGYSENGSVITSVAPANFVDTTCYYPGWSIGNEYNAMSNPDSYVWYAQSTNEGVFAYTAVETQTATITFNFCGNGYWNYDWSVTTG